ncbi:MAG TPA: hypothetical protein VH518_10030 [Tepidisphaeraceae bacterium]|jgi:hypothetical protein
MKLMNKNKLFAAAMMAAGTLTTACDLDKSSPRTFFGPEDRTRRVFQAADAQADAGANEDATLQSIHFTGSKLNALGAQKLAAMMPNEPGSEMTVYVNLAENDPVTAGRKDAVSQYLKSCGMDDAHIKITGGTNPNLLSPSAPGIAGLAKTDTSTGWSSSDTGSPTSSQPPIMAQTAHQ